MQHSVVYLKMKEPARSSTDLGPGEEGAVPRALTELASGRMVVVVDGEDPVNHGAVVMAAQFATPEALNFMNRGAGGWVCLALTAERCAELGLEPVPESDTHDETRFMAPFQSRDGVSTASAHDQAHSIQVAIDPSRGAADIVKPGHVQPVRAEPGGVLKNGGHTEAAVDLARLAGLSPAAILCEIQDDDGSMAGPKELAAFCAEHGFSVVEIADLIAHRHRFDRLIEEVVEVELPTRYGTFRAVAYRSLPDGDLHLAYVKGDVQGAEDVLVRVHTGCLTGDVFHSTLCGCGDVLEAALERIDREGRGVLVYLDPEPRGRGVFAELEGDAAHHDARHSTPAGAGHGSPVTLRRHGTGAQILRDLGLTSIRVLTNSPKRMVGLEGFGLEVTAQIPIGPPPDPAPRPATPHSR
jgi:3,4-dihydroxy 2-butanone 4-phosphate synthase / GTP cyclohydrolase II